MDKKKVVSCLFWFFILAWTGISNLVAQDCSAIQSLTSSQQQQISQVVASLEFALQTENWVYVDQSNSQLNVLFGDQAGIKDSPESATFNAQGGNGCIDLGQSLELAANYTNANSEILQNLWKLGKGLNPPTYYPHSLALRISAQIAVGLLQIAHYETDVTRKQWYESVAIQALDSLSTMQIQTGSSAGAFPFPDLRSYGDPVFSDIIQNFLDECGPDSVLVLQNGWIIDDRGSGDFKFDAGVIADAYYKAFLFTGNLAYKDIALQTASYLLGLKLSVNYNYNSFASLGLMAGYELSGDSSYLERALVNLRYGMAPGQAPNGHWIDGHNARSVYHALMIVNSIPALLRMDPNHPYFYLLKLMIQNAVSIFVKEASVCGFRTGFRWSIWSERLGETYLSTELRDSLHILVCKQIEQAELAGTYLDIPTLGDYLDYLNFANSEKEFQGNSFRIYPNPFLEKIEIENLPENALVWDVSINGLDGRLFYHKKWKGSTKLVLDGLNDLPGGNYFLMIHSGSNTFRSLVNKE